MRKPIALIFICTTILVTGCATSHHSSQWEYKTLQTHASGKLDSTLNELARDGWIVVSSSTSQNENSTPWIVIILKRQKQ
jgi:hypothetical protein